MRRGLASYCLYGGAEPALRQLICGTCNNWFGYLNRHIYVYVYKIIGLKMVMIRTQQHANKTTHKMGKRVDSIRRWEDSSFLFSLYIFSDSLVLFSVLLGDDFQKQAVMLTKSETMQMSKNSGVIHKTVL